MAEARCGACVREVGNFVIRPNEGVEGGNEGA